METIEQFIRRIPKHPMLGVENMATIHPDGRVIRFMTDGTTQVERDKNTASYYKGPNWK